MQQLETQLGLRVIDRTTCAGNLTPVGAAFLPKARQLVSDLEAAMLEVRDVRRHRRGSVVVTCVITAALHFLPDLLQRSTPLS